MRPKLIKGDIVKLSKKGRTTFRSFYKDSSLVVNDIIGDGVDRESIIVCRVANLKGEFEMHKFYRSELWYTGTNLFSKLIKK